MSEMLFVQLMSPDGKTVEGAATRHAVDGTDLGAGRMCVRQNGVDVVMAVDDMPPHWIEQIRRWQRFGDKLFG